jgi:Animal haem peroxidase
MPAHHVRDHCLAPTRRVDAPIYGGRYGRLLPALRPLVTDAPLLHALGRSGGPCDGAPFADGGGDDAREAAGWPLFGQFVAHDITADRSPVTHHADPDAIRNFRTPRVNLECVYGGGPVGSPYLYERDDTAKLLLGENDAGRPEDLPRNQEGIALIGDPRNDVHLFVAQLHVAMMRLHNLLVDRLREDGVPDDDLFDEARRAATWHYQWIVVHDFLPRLIGAELAGELLRRRAAGLPRRRAPSRAVHPVRVRRRRLSLRAQPDPPRLPDRARRPPADDLPRPRRLPAGPGGAGRRLDAAVRLRRR